jgi:hypothetical protein
VRRRIAGGLLAASLALATVAAGGHDATARPVSPVDARPAGAASPYAGLGAWVDVFDYVPAFAGKHPSITLATIDDLAARGVRTLYLQVSKADPRSPGLFADYGRATAMLRRAHRRGMQVVAWYLPTLGKISVDIERVEAIAALRTRGHRFDAVGLDIEDTSHVPNVNNRNRRLLQLARALDTAMPHRPIGAIVFAPIAIEVVHPEIWPRFPYTRLADHVDVWLPMSYSTYRDPASGFHDPARYARGNMARLRGHVPGAIIHTIGGGADGYNKRDARRFVEKVREEGGIGWSLYDAATTSDAVWTALQNASQ